MRIVCSHRRMCTRLSLVWTLLGVLMMSAAPAGTIAAARLQQSEPETYRFTDLGYGDRTARTMYGGLDYFFPVPAGEEPVEGARLELISSHSPLLLPERSTMTIIVNGLSVQSIRTYPRKPDAIVIDRSAAARTVRRRRILCAGALPHASDPRRV